MCSINENLIYYYFFDKSSAQVIVLIELKSKEEFSLMRTHHIFRSQSQEFQIKKWLKLTISLTTVDVVDHFNAFTDLTQDFKDRTNTIMIAVIHQKLNSN